MRSVAGRLRFSQKEKKTALPPKLFDLTCLQREANRVYGFTAKQTLDYAQSLYEKRFLTYPRTDSNYLTEDMRRRQPTLLRRCCLCFPLCRRGAYAGDWARHQQRQGFRPPRDYPYGCFCWQRL